MSDLITRLRKLQDAHGLEESDLEDIEDAIDKITGQSAEIEQLTTRLDLCHKLAGCTDGNCNLDGDRCGEQG